MKTLILALALVTTACGVDLAQKPQNSDTAAAATATKPDAAPDQKSASPTAQHAQATASASCSAGVSAGPATLDWHYDAQRRTFNQAKAATPDGYRLPTRVELLIALDNGQLSGYSDDVWTDTPVSGHASDHVWTVRTKDAYPADAWKEELFATLYVKDAP